MLIYLSPSPRVTSRQPSRRSTGTRRLLMVLPLKTTPHDDVLIAVENDTRGVEELRPKVRQRPRPTRCHFPVTRPLHPCSASPPREMGPQGRWPANFRQRIQRYRGFKSCMRDEVGDRTLWLLGIEVTTCKKINGGPWAPPWLPGRSRDNPRR